MPVFLFDRQDDQESDTWVVMVLNATRFPEYFEACDFVLLSFQALKSAIMLCRICIINHTNIIAAVASQGFLWKYFMNFTHL